LALEHDLESWRFDLGGESAVWHHVKPASRTWLADGNKVSLLTVLVLLGVGPELVCLLC
jgi:hypothetical protein